MKKSEMSKALTAMFLQYPGAEVTQPMVELWHRSLGRYSAAEFNSAVVEVLLTHTSTFPPTIGMLAEVLARNESGRVLTEGETWAALVSTVRRFGAYRSSEAISHLESVSPTIAATARAIGWETICRWDVGDEVSNRAHFWRMMAGFQKTEQTNKILGREVLPFLAEVKKREITHGN